MVDAKDILKKYSAKIESQLDSSRAEVSSEYSQFKEDMIHENTLYERWAKTLGNLVSIKISEKDKTNIERTIKEAHVDVTPSQAATLSIIAMSLIFFITLLSTVLIYLVSDKFSILFFVLGLVASITVYYFTYTMPKRLANSWKLKASSQMVPAILYIVVYMKHTSNLERAIEFASQHLEGPLALDFKKIFYDVEIGKYSTIKQSLDQYLETWNIYAPEFVESMHLVESSLYEPSETRRIEILEKSLQVILDGIYEKMLKYSREIRSPMTNVYMLGIILPTLGLSMVPLASTLLGGSFTALHLFLLFDLIIPLLVFFLTSEVLLKRPGGYGESSVLELNPDYQKFTSKKPWIKSLLIIAPLIIIGLVPFIFQIQFITNIFGLQHDYSFSQIGIGSSETMLFDFKNVSTSSTSLTQPSKIGPFGPLAIILSLLIPLAIALFFSISYKLKTEELIKSREKTKILEEEFTNSLFQLGNRLGDNIPAEIAFAKVAESTQGQTTQSFFAITNQNIQQIGMSLESAIFDKKRGAITYFPSALISTSMRILVESVKKGLQVAAQSLMSISDYVKNIQKINQRLRDLLAEIVSDMKSNMTFLAPLLAGIVVGLSAMITAVLGKLTILKTIQSSEGTLSTLSSIMNIFNSSEMIPPYFLQIAVGIYIIEITFILTKALVTIDSGKDPLKEKSELASNLKRAILTYILTALVSVVALSILVSVALSQL
ncbi:MAG: hypothetical protein AABX66_00565 [Nanoarchaeota archaeon]